jgi:hypothetical protein
MIAHREPNPKAVIIPQLVNFVATVGWLLATWTVVT